MKPEVVAIAGASGFVGARLCASLKSDFQVIGLSRSRVSSNEQDPRLQWRQCDLYSLLQAEQALHGVDLAIYLVHSMSPSARLSQGHFSDFDALAADNFARAAAVAGVKRIIYVSGIAPLHDELSPHLQSRIEVEYILQNHGVPLVVLRCGLIIGAEGSSSNVLTSLVRKLPLMICPSWTSTKSSPVAVEDVLSAVRIALDKPMSKPVERFDIGGPEVLSYRNLMQRTAQVLGLRRYMLPVPLLSPRLSRLWVSIVTGAPKSLMKPLIESLRHDMLPDPNYVLPGYEPKLSIAEALQRAVTTCSESSPRAFSSSGSTEQQKTVRSLQRLKVADNWTAERLGVEYFNWLQSKLRFLLHIERSVRWIRLYVHGLKRPLLEFEKSHARSVDSRALYYIRGGLLHGGNDRARLEFRQLLPGFFLVAVHDYRPTLPWYLYVLTQARIHAWVMNRFAKHLQ